MAVPVPWTSPSPAESTTDRLDRARLYLCTDGRRERGDLAAFLDAVLAGGVDVVQLREKHLEAAEELALLDVVREACARHGALFAVNDRADLAALSGADLLHLGQRDLLPAQARRLVGPDVLIGRSSHSPAQAARAAADPEVDYYCIGPVWPTPTKPGRPAAGLDAVAAVAAAATRASAAGWPATEVTAAEVPAAEVPAADVPAGSGPARAKPWFAIGGIDEGTLAQVTASGAERVVVVRALTEAADPAAVARELARALGRPLRTAPRHD